MTGAIIAQLLIKFGPIAFDWISDLHEVWSKEMTPEEVEKFCKDKKKSYDDYILAEKLARGITS